MKRALPVVALILLLAQTAVFGSVGIGAKLAGGATPFIVGEIGSERLSAELGVGLRTLNLFDVARLSFIWYSATVRSGIPFGALVPYLGIGISGMSLVATSTEVEGYESVTILGAVGEGGLRYSFVATGIPLDIYGALVVNWFPSAGDLELLGISSLGLGWQIGAVVRF